MGAGQESDAGALMTLYILVNREPQKVDLYDWDKWRNEHEKDCRVACNYVCGDKVETRFHGNDQTGGGYIFATKIRNEIAYQTKTWEEAEYAHSVACRDISYKRERELLKQAHKEHRPTK